MTQIGELVNPAIEFEKHDGDCYFCKKENKKLDPLLNETDDNFSEDTLVGLATVGGIEHHNNSGKLGTACAPTPSAGKSDPVKGAGMWITETGWGDKLKLEFAAHHLIPGDAALQKSKLFKDDDVGLKVKGKAVGNIGYDVNSKINGVWLPGNYAYGTIAAKAAGQGWGEGGAAFGKWSGVAPADYAAAAITTSRSQFHDSHGDYSKHVLKTLDLIYDKLEKTVDVPWCPEAGKQETKENKVPMYSLVGRLASLSSKLRKKVTFPTTSWATNIFTSKFSKSWMEKQP